MPLLYCGSLNCPLYSLHLSTGFPVGTFEGSLEDVALLKCEIVGEL